MTVHLYCTPSWSKLVLCCCCSYLPLCWALHSTKTQPTGEPPHTSSAQHSWKWKLQNNLHLFHPWLYTCAVHPADPNWLCALICWYAPMLFNINANTSFSILIFTHSPNLQMVFGQLCTVICTLDPSHLRLLPLQLLPWLCLPVSHSHQLHAPSLASTAFIVYFTSLYWKEEMFYCKLDRVVPFLKSLPMLTPTLWKTHLFVYPNFTLT